MTDRIPACSECGAAYHGNISCLTCLGTVLMTNIRLGVDSPFARRIYLIMDRHRGLDLDLAEAQVTAIPSLRPRGRRYIDLMGLGTAEEWLAAYYGTARDRPPNVQWIPDDDREAFQSAATEADAFADTLSREECADVVAEITGTRPRCRGRTPLSRMRGLVFRALIDCWFPRVFVEPRRPGPHGDEYTG